MQRLLIHDDGYAFTFSEVVILTRLSVLWRTALNSVETDFLRYLCRTIVRESDVCFS